jgi:hypothetical protein
MTTLRTVTNALRCARGLRTAIVDARVRYSKSRRENARLRDCIERMRPGAGEQCLWCSRRGYVEPHTDDCPAFNADGSVR